MNRNADERRFHAPDCILRGHLFSCGALAQEGVPADSFGNEVLAVPGTYALPIIPLISTPTVALAPPVLRVGAGDSTGDNTVGAQNSTAEALHQGNRSLIVPRLEGAPVSQDLYPRAAKGDSY